MKLTPKKIEMYMADTRTLRWGPNMIYIPPVRFGFQGNTNFSVCLGGNSNFSLLDTNMLVYPMQNFIFGVLSNVNPQSEKFCIAVEHKLKAIK